MVSSAPDIVIPVREGDHNPELRWALRSLANIPHGTVWLAGHMPHWVRGCRCIPTTQNASKHQNSTTNLLAACNHDAVAEHFLLWNDDIFLLEQLERIEPMHRGTMAHFIERHAHLGNSQYMRGVRTTAEILTELGYRDALCYELHVPLPLTKAGVLAAHAAATAEGMPPTRALQLRSLTANMLELGGEQVDDVKVQAITQPTWAPGPVPFVSTTDTMWGRKHPAATYVSELYPRPGPYEAQLPKAAVR